MINHGFIVTRALLEERKRSRSISKKMLGIYQLEWKALISIEMEWKALSSLRLILKTSKQYFGKNMVFQQPISQLYCSFYDILFHLFYL